MDDVIRFNPSDADHGLKIYVDDAEKDPIRGGSRLDNAKPKMGNGLASATLEPSEFGSNLDEDGKPRTNRQLLNHKIR